MKKYWAAGAHPEPSDMDTLLMGEPSGSAIGNSTGSLDTLSVAQLQEQLMNYGLSQNGFEQSTLSLDDKTTSRHHGAE